MWEFILLKVSKSIGEALFDNYFKVLKQRKNKKILEKITSDTLNEFADTTLDCNDFHNLINSSRFITSLRTLYFVLFNNSTETKIIESMCNLVNESCPNVNRIETFRFFKKIDIIFNELNQKILLSDDQSFALMTLIVRSNRVIVDKINESEEYFKRWINKSIEKTKFDDEIIDEYNKNCILAYGVMKFTGIVGTERKNSCKLDQLYVKNDFYIYSTKISESFDFKYSDNRIDLKDFFNFNNRIVILGGAGFGKSTSLNYIFCNEKQLGLSALKFKIDLKEYASSIIDNKIGILECLNTEFSKFIPHHFGKNYDIKTTISNHLYQGNCLVIFDALDEVDSQSSRDKIRNEIAVFCNVYSLNKFIITSREVGYLNNKFDESFLHLRIGLFTDSQIETYVKKWFVLNVTDKEDSQIKLSKFMLEVERAKCLELIRNPIILVLALIVFYNENNLPHKRIEFYKKCIDTFLVEREKRKDAFDMTGIECIRGDDLILPRMAYYKFEKEIEDQNYILTLTELKLSLYKALEVEDRRNWINPVNRFIKYLIERSELIGEIDDNKYDFAHKTFSEYFIAVFYAKSIDIKCLLNNLDNWVGDSNYDELANLIIEVIIEENVSYQHNILLNFLLDNFKKYSDIHTNQNLKDRRDFYEKANNYHRIINKLFNNNSLLPKYIEKYHYILLEHPEVVDYWNTKSNILSKDFFIDEELLYKLFKQKYEENENIQFKDLIKILYFFRELFSKRKKDLISKLHKNSVELFNLLDHTKNNKYNYQDLKDLLYYFLNEKYEVIQDSEIIFYSLLKILLTYKKQLDNIDEYYDKLCLFDVENNCYFSSFIHPDLLFNLILESNGNQTIFALLIKSLVIGTNDDRQLFYLEFVLKYKGRFRNEIFKNSMIFDNISIEDYNNKIITQSKFTYDLLTQSNSISEFIYTIKEKGLYSVKYEKIYDSVFMFILKYRTVQ